MNKHNFIVYEYERLWATKELPTTDGKTENHPKLTKADFDDLRSFILRQEEGASESLSFKAFETENATACMKLSASKYGQEILTVQNYVGTIMLPSGTTIEILPKR
jgi:hypothetical protein